MVIGCAAVMSAERLARATTTPGKVPALRPARAHPVGLERGEGEHQKFPALAT